MLRWQTAGESHGEALVAMIEGLPAGVRISTDDIVSALARRRLGYGRGARMKFEQDKVRLLTGVQFPMTLTDKGNGHKVTVDADETFENGVLWQQDAESFVCMEPWNGWANSVNEDGKHEVLEPDEAMTSEWSITIEKA